MENTVSLGDFTFDKAAIYKPILLQGARPDR